LLDSSSDADSFSASRRAIAESRRFFDSSSALTCAAFSFGAGAAFVEGAAVALPLVALVLAGSAICSSSGRWESSISSDTSLALRDGPGGLPRPRLAGAAGAEGATFMRFGRGIFTIKFARSNL